MKYVGFVSSSIYYPELWDFNDNLEQSVKDQLYNEYLKKVRNAKSNIPTVNFSVKEYGGKDTNDNYIHVENYLSPISIILSLDRTLEDYPVFVDQTTLSTDFYVEYPTIYIKFFIKHKAENQVSTYTPATLVISSDNKFYILIDGAFYSLKNNLLCIPS